MKYIWLPPQNSRLLGRMESLKRWVAIGDLERNRNTSKIPGIWPVDTSQNYIFEMQGFFQGFSFCSLSMTNKKLRQCISLLKGCNLHIIIWHFGYCTDNETNLLCKCSCIDTQDAFPNGDTCIIIVVLCLVSDYKFLRFVWVGSSVSLLCGV